MAGKKGRSGPLKGSMNALKNGRTLGRTRLTVGELPSKMISVKREGRDYRRNLEGPVMELLGLSKPQEIPAMEAHYIDTATAATIHAGICRWLLRNRLEKMSVSDIRGCGDGILKAKQVRDTSVKALANSLDAPPPVPWLDVTSEPGNGDKP